MTTLEYFYCNYGINIAESVACFLIIGNKIDAVPEGTLEGMRVAQAGHGVAGRAGVTARCDGPAGLDGVKAVRIGRLDC